MTSAFTLIRARKLRHALNIALVLAVAAVPANALRAETLEVAFWNRAPKLIETFRDKNFANVGVLKFHVQKPDGKLTHSAGTLNYNAARRLETALVLALANEKNKPAGVRETMIVRDATKTAAAIPQADHLSKSAWKREKLFATIYAPSWGDKQAVMPDAFITGTLVMNKGLTKMSVQLALIEKSNPGETQPLSTFDVDVRTDTLIETGHAFRSFDISSLEKEAPKTKNPELKEFTPVVVTKPLIDPKTPGVDPKSVVGTNPGTNPVVGTNPGANPVVGANPTVGTNPVVGANPGTVTATAGPPVVVQPAESKHPIEVSPKEDLIKIAPVELQMFYDRQLVTLTNLGGGQYAAPAPRPGQKVVFGMVRRDNAVAEKYGVVLQLNGISTLGMERKPPAECQRWVFAQNDKAGFVSGFYKGDKTVAGFEVVPPTAELQTEYKENLGIISYTIFKEGLAAPRNPTTPLKDRVAEAAITRLVSQGASLDQAQPQQTAVKDPAAKPEVNGEDFPPDLPRSLASLRQRLEQLAAEPLRNAIVPGQVQSIDPLETTTFVDPGVQMSITIRYFKGN